MEEKRTMNMIQALEEKRALKRDLAMVFISFVVLLAIFAAGSHELTAEMTAETFLLACALYIPIRICQSLSASLFLAIIIIVGYCFFVLFTIEKVGQGISVFFFGLPIVLIVKHIFMIHKYTKK